MSCTHDFIIVKKSKNNFLSNIFKKNNIGILFSGRNIFSPFKYLIENFIYKVEFSLFFTVPFLLIFSGEFEITL